LNLNYTHDKMKWIDVTVHKKNACILVRPDWHKTLKNWFFLKVAAEEVGEKREQKPFMS
jgi:hypothetical protein